MTGIVYGNDLGKDKEKWLKDKDYLALVFDIERL
jgi:hypothetical protein